ncbi:Uma2 family endonuclease [Tundrisphaera lichenicola]|uniref:Uma2 family endonuclease n=1 Tax=Tundrisphaera lichenicola TaxID=2029860 RepID=UPI003EBCBF1D
MATASTTLDSISTPGPQAGGDQCVEMCGIGWGGYQAMLKLRSRASVPRMTYLDGDLWLMSPSFFHELLAERLGSFVVEVSVGLGIPYIPAGHTTFRRLKKRGGAEADKCYYFGNEGRVRGKEKIDLRGDPPPDLVIEAIHNHDAEAAIEVWRRFGVPELWACDASELRILNRQANGRYAESETSLIFPFLKKSEIFEWARRPATSSEMEWSREVRLWVQEALVPRVRGQVG